MYSMVDCYADMGQIGKECPMREYNIDDLELDQVTQVIGYHPRYLDHFLRTQNFIMNGDGPLPYDYRYYLAIIAAARHHCPYLVKMYEKEFINQGGNPEWLNGLDFIPPKLRAIYEINKILAHRPWLLRKEHIESLTRGKNSWSLSEVVHAMVLLSHFHSLSSFVFSCGLTQKLDGLSSPKLKTSPATVAIGASPQQIPHNAGADVIVGSSNAGGGGGGGVGEIMLQHHTTAAADGGGGGGIGVGAGSAALHLQPQKTVLSEITLNNNNNNNNNSMDHHNHQIYCNNNATNNILLMPNIGGTVHSSGGLGAAVVAAGVIGAGATGGIVIGGPSNGGTATSPPAVNAASNGINKVNAQPGVTVEALMERMKVLSQKQDECSEAELSNRFKNVEMQTAELPAAATIVPTEIPPVISHYIEDPNFTYQDFARRGAENIPNTFRIQDYSWDDHGYSLVNGLYEDVGTLLDNKFRCAYNLTYFTMGGVKNVDTSKFRRAIWNYIQCIYGIRHDDYDYGEVNQLLDRPLKMFIKTACCFPERITTKDYDSILLELQDSEKVHVNLMVMEARNQAELLYALREIMRYRT
ncbi:sestrin [Haematobia irritans]|uniref:sestrin n=1 Tax=Haematobia irritans TaxID=7368 RepID=UPI003F4F516C